jgi:CheY-like chemotaxis protein
MPGLSGYDVARKLHRNNPRPVVIALTAYSQHSDKVAAKQAGFDHFLTKPVEFEMLFGLLSMVAQSLHRPDPA